MRTHRVTRPITAVLALLGIFGLSVALADPPTTPQATPAAAAPAATAAPEASAPTAPAANTNSTAKADKAAENEAALEKRLTNSGYKAKMRNGTKVWCKRQDELGSHLGAQEICGTPEELKMVVQQNQDVMKDAQRLHTPQSK